MEIDATYLMDESLRKLMQAIRELVELGYQDVTARREAIAVFHGL